MKLIRITVISLIVVLSATLLLVVDFAGLHPASVLSDLSVKYTPLIIRVNFLSYPDLYLSAFRISLVLLIILIVLIRKTYGSRLQRLGMVALPLFIALCIQYLFVNKIDEYIFIHHNFSGFVKLFFTNFLSGFLMGHLTMGMILFLIIMITCYPAAILIDKVLCMRMDKK